MELNRKEFIWSATVGTFIGAMLGIMIGLSMFKEHKKCEVLKRENRLLRDMVMFYQDQQLKQNVDSVIVCGE